MNTRDLEYVLALAETGHFGRAAARCRVSQPTLSTQVAKLEHTLGAALFERGPRRVTLTPAGQRVVQQARVVLDECDRLRHAAEEVSDQIAGPFKLGAIPTVGPYLLPHTLPVLKREHPEMELLIREEVTASLIQRLIASDLEAAIVSLPIDEPAVVTREVLDEPFVAALPPDHPLAKHKRVKPEALNGEKMLLLEEGHCMRAQILSLCDRRRRDPSEFQANGIESLRQMVGAGLGCTVLPMFAAMGPFAEHSSVQVRPFAGPTPKRPLVLAWRRSCPRGRALEKLADAMSGALRQTLREHNGA